MGPQPLTFALQTSFVPFTLGASESRGRRGRRGRLQVVDRGLAAVKGLGHDGRWFFPPGSSSLFGFFLTIFCTTFVALFLGGGVIN